MKLPNQPARDEATTEYSADGALTVESLVSVAILCFYGVAGAIPGIAPNQAAEMTGRASGALSTAAGLLSQAVVNATIVLLILRYLPRLYSRVRLMQWSAALALFALFSTAWSQEPLLTARRAVPFSLAALFAFYFVLRFSQQRQLALLRATFLLLAIGSAVAALAFPHVGLDASTGHAGNWQGVFSQKNACGRAMVFATASVLCGTRRSPRLFFLLLAFLAVLVLSGSRGAWGIEILLLLGLALVHLLVRLELSVRGWFAIGVAVAALAGSAAAKALFPFLAELAGRDATLTGRTAIWAQVWRSILERPWFGYGFSAFWRGSQGASFNVVVALRFVLFHAHNGFLEIWLELGAVGLFIFALSYLRACWKLWPLLRAGNVAQAAWPFSILLLTVAYDLDENTLLSFNGLFWVLYVSALVQIEFLAERLEAARSQPATFRVPSRRSKALYPTGPAWLS